VLQPTLAPEKSKQHFQDEHQRIEKYNGNNRNLLDLVMKAEKEHQQMQMPLLEKKRVKKKSRGLHL
jgi:hypothetical protein